MTYIGGAPGIVPRQAEVGDTAARIEGNSLGYASFHVVMPKGPVGIATFVTEGTWTSTFGSAPSVGYEQDWYAIQAFFRNGGLGAWVTRVVHWSDLTDVTSHTALKSYVDLDDGADPGVAAIKVEAIYHGVYADGDATSGIGVAIIAGALDAAKRRLEVYWEGSKVWTSKDFSADPTARDFVQAIVNGEQTYIEVTDQGNAVVPEALGVVNYLANGDDGLTDLVDADFSGSEAAGGGTGLHTLDDIMWASPIAPEIIVAPRCSKVTTTLAEAVVAYADTNYALAVISPYNGLGSTDAALVTFIRACSSAYGQTVMAYPQLVPGDLAGAATEYQNAGQIAGLLSRAVRNRWIHKSPAGLASGKILDVAAVELIAGRRAMGEVESATLNPYGVGVIRTDLGGFTNWGSRVVSTDPRWQQIGPRRCTNFAVHSIRRGTLWAVHEPLNDDLARSVERSVLDFYRGLWDNPITRGAFEFSRRSFEDNVIVTVPIPEPDDPDDPIQALWDNNTLLVRHGARWAGAAEWIIEEHFQLTSQTGGE